MQLGLPIQAVYIVPMERFCWKLGLVLGANLDNFKFPTCFNFFVQ